MIEIKLNNIGCVALTPELSAALQAVGEDVSQLNRLVWPAGASNYAKGVFLMYSDEAEALRAGDRSASITVQMNDDTLPAGGNVYADKMYQIEHRPIHTMAQSQSIEPYKGLYAVTVVDERYFWKGIVFNAAYDVTTTADRSVYYDVSKNAGSAWTWAGIIAAILSAIGVTADVGDIDSAAGDPTDELFYSMSAAATLDRVCASLGMVFAASLTAGSGKRYHILRPLQTYGSMPSLDDDALSHNGPWITERVGGGTTWRADSSDGQAWLNAIMPSSVTVLFPRQIPATAADNAASANPPPLRQIYVATSTAGKPSGVTGRTGYTATVSDNMWAIGPIGSETNAAALQARADYLAGVYYQRWIASCNDVRMRGWIANTSPVAGEVSWSLTPEGPHTDVHTRPEWSFWGGDRDVVDGFTDKQIIGLGGVQTHKSFDGSLIISANSSANATATASMVTGITVVGNNMTVNKEIFTVNATGPTSTQNIVLPGSGGVSNIRIVETQDSINAPSVTYGGSFTDVTYGSIVQIKLSGQLTVDAADVSYYPPACQVVFTFGFATGTKQIAAQGLDVAGNSRFVIDAQITMPLNATSVGSMAVTIICGNQQYEREEAIGAWAAFNWLANYFNGLGGVVTGSGGTVTLPNANYTESQFMPPQGAYGSPAFYAATDFGSIGLVDVPTNIQASFGVTVNTSNTYITFNTLSVTHLKA